MSRDAADSARAAEPAPGAPLAFTVVVREGPERRFEISSRLLLDLIGERVDLEAV